MFGLSRALVLAGVKSVNGVDWYKKGAEIILKKQQNDGSWYSGSKPTDVLETCWNLLFLTKATIPFATDPFQSANK